MFIVRGVRGEEEKGYLGRFALASVNLICLICEYEYV